MTRVLERSATLQSGDVALFYRHFGQPGAVPVIIIHGANYYDSHDWIDVATALAVDREVVAYDSRGFGDSGWSPARDYSHDALTGDLLALLDHLRWPRAVVMGHSMGGSLAILFGARYRERTAGVIIVDHCPGEGGGARPQPAGIPKPFPTLEAALAASSRDPRTPLARMEMACRPVDGGFVFRRDPAFSNRVPDTPGWTPGIVVDDPWAELARIQAPALIVRATKSDRYSPEKLARVARDFPHIPVVDVPSGHDVAGGAPDALIAASRDFLARLPPA